MKGPCGNGACAGPEPGNGHDRDRPGENDHEVWTSFLQQYPEEGDNDVTRLDYGAVDLADQERLDDCIDRLDQAADGCINDSRGFTVDDGDPKVSSVYHWSLSDVE